MTVTIKWKHLRYKILLITAITCQGLADILGANGCRSQTSSKEKVRRHLHLVKYAWRII